MQSFCAWGGICMAGDIGKLHPKEDFWKQVHFLFFSCSFPFIFLSMFCFWFLVLIFVYFGGFGGFFWWCFGLGFFWRVGNFCFGFLWGFLKFFCIINGTDLTWTFKLEFFLHFNSIMVFYSLILFLHLCSSGSLFVYKHTCSIKTLEQITFRHLC